MKKSMAAATILCMRYTHVNRILCATYVSVSPGDRDIDAQNIKKKKKLINKCPYKHIAQWKRWRCACAENN